MDTLVYSTNKSDRHDIAEIMLKVALNTINLNLSLCFRYSFHWLLNVRSGIVFAICINTYFRTAKIFQKWSIIYFSTLISMTNIYKHLNYI